MDVIEEINNCSIGNSSNDAISATTITATNNYSEIINKAIEFVKDELKNNDPSHDFNHVSRVWSIAKSIAISESYSDSDSNDNGNPTELLELAAILHDVKDHKYLNIGEDENTASKTIISFLTSSGYPLIKAQKIATIVSQISFKNELGNTSPSELLIESKIVQDADRLDAIGAVGIARTFSFGAIKNRPFYGESTIKLMNSDVKTVEMTQDNYKKQTSPTIDHFYEKLFKLESMMKTNTGKKMAKKRNEFMVEFINQFNNELNNNLS